MNHSMRKHPMHGTTSKRLLALAILYFLFLVALVFLCYDCFFGARPGDLTRENVTLPDVVGQDVDHAMAMLDTAAYRVSLCYRYDEEQPSGTVLGQSPAAGMRRKLDTRAGEQIDVTLTVSLGPHYETVPSLIGTDGREAQLALEGQGFSVRVIRRTAYGASTAADRVFRTDPPAGSILPSGSTVTLYVAYPKATPSVQCPSLVGMDRMSALAALRAAGLSPGKMTVQKDGEELPLDGTASDATRVFWAEDTVVSQGRPAGCWLPRGSQVDLVLQRASRFEFELYPTHPKKGTAHPWITSPRIPNFTEGSSNA